uniref:Calponin-homology (CH) domain-containing protein n=1 Tax=Sinocyclocheilus anshuiensis TaxID=1608454 RepID=A0A671RQG3_9TELE
MKDVMSSLQQTNSEKILLSWVRNCTRNYNNVNVLNFTTSWADGLAFNAILHHFRPHGFSWEEAVRLTPVERLDHAFTFAKDQLNIERLLDPEDVAVQLPDKKSIIMYVTSLFAVFPNDITIDDIREVETLPRRYKVEHEDGHAGLSGKTEEVSSTRPETPSTLTEVDREVSLDTYQITLEEVLTWLLSAEDTLHMQDDVSDDVEEVKDQFHTHEAFMMELTAHQSSVGNVLQAGNQLIAQGNLSEEEEDEIREQMTLLNSRWENLRVASMDRQSRLHEVLMNLQQQQLQQLSDWLTQMEGRIRKMEKEPIAGDMEGYLTQIEEHKVLQNDLELEQVKVNSLTHMVVVVDENSGESATAALEEQLQSLGERWAAVCRWMEERWNKLEEFQLVWQRLLDDQSLFGSWLADKEKALSEVQTSDYKDPSEINASVRRLAVKDRSRHRPTDSTLGQPGPKTRGLLQPSQINASHVFMLMHISFLYDLDSKLLFGFQVTEAVSVTGMPQVQEKIFMETVTTVTTWMEQTFTSSDRELPPPAPPKRRHLDIDGELRRLAEADVPKLLSQLAAWKSSARAAEDPPVLKEKLQTLGMELAENEGAVKELVQKGEKMIEQLEKAGLSSEEARSGLDSVHKEWESCQNLIQDLRNRAQILERVAAVQSGLKAVNEFLQEQEKWLISTKGFRAKDNQQELQALKDGCEARIAELEKLQPQVEDLCSQTERLATEPGAPDTMRPSVTALASRHSTTIQELKTQQQDITIAFLSKLVVSRALQQMESRLNTASADIRDITTAEQGVIKAQALCAEIEQQLQEAAEQQAWTELSTAAQDQLSMLQCILGSMEDTKVKSEEVERWLDAVEELLSRDASGFSHGDKLQEELNQCKELLSEMESVASSLKQIKENVAAVQQSSGPGLISWGQTELDDSQRRWDTLSKELLRREERVSEGQEKVMNLKKDVAEMREWMIQVDEEFLMRDFEYKSPEELEEALQDMKRAKEDVLQKEVRVKILKDSINVLIGKTPPGGPDLSPELTEVLQNYQKLCDRFKSKCHTLEEVWSCWIELLQYLDAESGWMNTLEEKVQATENLPENTESISEALESLESDLRHPGDNRTQIRELAQTLIDGGILDELISEKLESFNSRYEELTQLAAARQMSLEQKLGTLRENETALHTLQTSLTQLDQTLTLYLTDRIDAFQLPQEAQVIQAEIAAHEATLEDLRRRNVGNVPPTVPEGKPVRGGTLLDQLQVRHNTAPNHRREVEMFDENLAHISTWLYQTEIRLDEMEKMPAAEKERMMKAVLCELEGMSVRVDSARDQAVILMTSRGTVCRELVEPKLADLNCSFHKVAQHIISAQEAVRPQQEAADGRSAPLLSSSQLQLFESDLQATIRGLEQQEKTHTPDDERLDEEKAHVEEVLRRGEEVLLSVPDEDRREDIRRRLLLLQTCYKELHIIRTQPVVLESLSVPLQSSESSLSPQDERSVSVSPSDYLLDINKVLLAMTDNELLLNTSELSGGLFEDFSSQEDTLRNIKESLERLGEQVEVINERQPDVILEASRQEMAQISDALTQLNSEWDRVNRMYSQRKGCFDGAVEEWRQFHCDMNDLSQWLSDTEQVLADGIGPDGELDLDRARAQQQDLEEGLASHQSVLAVLSRSGEHIIGQVSSPDAALLQEKLDALRRRWTHVEREACERQRRLMGENPAVMDVVQRTAGLAQWLEHTEVAVETLPVSATDKSLRELKALTEEMDGQNETLSWLNKTGSQILSNSSLSPQDRDTHMNQIRQINISWSKASRELLDKLREVEGRLQTHTPLQDERRLASYGQFQERMDRLGDWVYISSQSLSDVTPAERQVLEMSMREQKQELEELLSFSIELQRKQLLLPQEKSKIEQLAADWKALDARLKETPQQPLSPWTQQVSQQQFTGSVPSAVHMVSLMSEERRPSPELVGPSDLHQTATELADWLLLIHQMLKSNIVTVGDKEEIHTTIGRLQVTKGDLEQRHPQLEDIITLAQNIKNKTSNLDVRTSISEKLEKVRSQWDGTQHGVEARLLQLECMIGHSDQWEEQRHKLKALIGQNEMRLHNLLQLNREPLTKQISDNKAFLQELSRGQESVTSFNELSNQLLQEYAADDTRKVTEVMDKLNTAWNSVNNRALDRQAALDSELKSLQACLRELESFLKWLHEAETTVNVLSDAAQREELLQDSAHIKELEGQLGDIQAEIEAHNDVFRSVDGNKMKMVKALGSSEEAVFLQQRLDDMNQRWNDLKTKSANIRAHLEASAERWNRLLSVLEELGRWISVKDEELNKQMPIGGDVPTVLQQQTHCTVRATYSCNLSTAFV